VFSGRYFTPRYFPTRYFAKIGGVLILFDFELTSIRFASYAHSLEFEGAHSLDFEDPHEVTIK